VALLLALVSALFYGTADFLGGLAARRSAALAATVLAQGAGLVLVALALPFFPGEPPRWGNTLWGVGAGLTGGLGVALLYYGLAVGRVSVVAPVTAVCSIAIPVLVAMALGERPGLLAISGIALAVLSVGLISRQVEPEVTPSPGTPRIRDRSIVIALASGVAIGAFLVCLARAGTRSGLWPLLVARVASTVALAAAARVARVRLAVPRAVLALVLACGALDVLANALYLVAAGNGPLGLVATLASLYPASTVLLARLVLGERLRPVQSLGLACAAVAIVMITMR
jgi:drug/metabolite transporter (DMT)-like permease